MGDTVYLVEQDKSKNGHQRSHEYQWRPIGEGEEMEDTCRLRREAGPWDLKQVSYEAGACGSHGRWRELPTEPEAARVTG